MYNLRQLLKVHTSDLATTIWGTRCFPQFYKGLCQLINNPIYYIKQWSYVNRFREAFIFMLNWRSDNHIFFLSASEATSTWWRHQMETFSALLAICEFPTQRPVTRNFDVYFDLRPNNRLSKQSWGWWYETPSRLLWCRRNEDGQIVFK